MIILSKIRLNLLNVWEPLAFLLSLVFRSENSYLSGIHFVLALIKFKKYNYEDI